MNDLPILTSESVSAGHPDKICDQISDAILDACLTQDPDARIAIEAAIKGQTLMLFGEITAAADVDLADVARSVLADIGYEDPSWGLDLGRLEVIERVGRQSREIADAVDGQELGAGDQGLMFGYACDDTPSLMPLPIYLAHRLMSVHDALRRTGAGTILGPDAKAQVTVVREGGTLRVTDVVLSSQHRSAVSLMEVRAILEDLARGTLGPHWREDIRLHLNPAGPFTEGGPAADAGLTGRKIIVDSYGGAARHGGGAFSGKDGTKVDRSGAYAARQLARDVVARGWARACEVQVAYAIGEPAPISIGLVGSGIQHHDIARRYADIGIDLAAMLRPAAILDRLSLREPLFRRTATFGHFGRSEFPWELPLGHVPAQELTAVACRRDVEAHMPGDRLLTHSPCDARSA